MPDNLAICRATNVRWWLKPALSQVSALPVSTPLRLFFQI